MKRYIKHIKLKVINPLLVKNKTKWFCIGRNKTGTTSLGKAFEDLGFIVGHQQSAEKLLRAYRDKNYNQIIDYCKSAQVFQDVPFSHAETFKFLDKAYPRSKFILTVRDNPDQWYNSLTTFHSKLFGGGSIPSAQQLKNADYVWKGWMWENNRINYQTPEDDPYQKEIMIKNYLDHNQSVLDYFKERPDDLLVINLAEKESYKRFVDFLGVDSPFMDFPWENKTLKHSTR